MNLEEQSYLDLMRDVLANGAERTDRTGVGTKSKFCVQLRFSLENNTLPLLTTRKMFFRGIVEELLFFLRGQTNSKILEDKGINIWKGNTTREFLDSRGLHHLPEGEIGEGSYGKQWRNFGSGEGTDQIKYIIDLLKTDPTSRRILLSAWNPQQIHLAALPPCHLLYSLYVNGDELSAMWLNRSSDAYHGFGFNLASYAVLTHILAKIAGLKAKELVFVGNDFHVYKTHEECVKEQMIREPFPFPQIEICKDLQTIEDVENLQFQDIKLVNYKHHSALKKVDMVV